MYEVLGRSEVRDFTSKAGNPMSVVELYLQDCKKSNGCAFGIAVKAVTIFKNLADPTVYLTAIKLKEGQKCFISYDERGYLADITPID